MTQRVQLSALIDRLAIDELISGYAATVDDGDWPAYEALFSPDGRADYRPAGGIEGPAGEVSAWLAKTMKLFPVRQHLIVNRRILIEDLDDQPGDLAQVHADYLNPMRLDEAAQAPVTPNFFTGGRYAFAAVRSRNGWRLREVVVHEKWRMA